MNVPYNIVRILFIALGFYTGNIYVLAIGLLIASYSQFTYLLILVKTKTSKKVDMSCDRLRCDSSNYVGLDINGEAQYGISDKYL